MMSRLIWSTVFAVLSLKFQAGVKNLLNFAVVNFVICFIGTSRVNRITSSLDFCYFSVIGETYEDVDGQGEGEGEGLIEEGRLIQSSLNICN